MLRTAAALGGRKCKKGRKQRCLHISNQIFEQISKQIYNEKSDPEVAQQGPYNPFCDGLS